MASQVAECDVRNLNSKEHSKQSICPFVSKLRAKVEAEALTSRDGGVRGPLLPPIAAADGCHHCCSTIIEGQWHVMGLW